MDGLHSYILGPQYETQRSANGKSQSPSDRYELNDVCIVTVASNKLQTIQTDKVSSRQLTYSFEPVEKS